MTPFWRVSKQRWVLPYLDAAGVKRQHVIPPESAAGKGARKAALDYARVWEQSQEIAGKVPGVRREGLTVANAAPRWLELRRAEMRDGKPRYQPATIGDNKSHLDTIILPAFGDTPIATLEAQKQKVRQWVRDVAAKHSAQHTRNVFGTFKGLVDSAMGEGWVPLHALAANPLDHPTVLAVLPASKRQSGVRPVHVPLEDAQKLIACVKVKAGRRVRYIVALCTGLSEGELAGRVWADVNLDSPRPTLTVTGALQTRGADGWASLGPTKNEHRLRTIPLHNDAAAALRWWRQEGWRDQTRRTPKPGDPIFPGRGAAFSRPGSAAHLRADLRRSGCSDTCHGHPITAQALRRCFATYLDAAGVHEEQRMRLMGHAPRTVNAKHYTAAQVETDRAAVNLIALTWAVPDEVPAEVPSAPNPAKCGSHLRDLNSRPTVYENVGELCGVVPKGPICRRHPTDTANVTHDRNGIRVLNGTSEVPDDGCRGAIEVPRGRPSANDGNPARGVHADTSALALRASWAHHAAAVAERADAA